MNHKIRSVDFTVERLC